MRGLRTTSRTIIAITITVITGSNDSSTVPHHTPALVPVLLQALSTPDVHLQALVTSLVRGLQDSPRIVSNCCWALMNLAEGMFEQYEIQEGQESGPMSPYFHGIVSALLAVTETCVCPPLPLL